jgi:hypothetical protein
LLIEGRLPTWLHRFLAAFVRYQGQVTAWFDLLSARYPDPLHTVDHPFRIESPSGRGKSGWSRCFACCSRCR